MGANKVFGELDNAHVNSPPAGVGALDAGEVVLDEDEPTGAELPEPTVDELVPEFELVPGTGDVDPPGDDPELLHAASTIATVTAAAAAAVRIRRRIRPEALRGSDSKLGTCYLLGYDQPLARYGSLDPHPVRDDMGWDSGTVRTLYDSLTACL